MRGLKKAVRWIIDLFEVHIPIAVFIMLFIVFLINVLFRYVIRNPQNWTFEFSVNSFVIVGLLGACTAYRKEDHVVFDLLYSRISEKSKNIFRIISYVFIIIFFSRAVTSIMKIPLKIIFSSFPILLISTVLRSAYRLVLDIKSFKNKTYIQLYNNNEEEKMI